MASHEPVPTVADFVRAFAAGVGSEQAPADVHDGSLYDHCAGGGALIFKRLTEHSQDEFHAIYFDSATDERLDEYVERHFGEDEQRVKLTAGTGTAFVRRSSPGSGRFLDGARIAVSMGNGSPVAFWVVDGNQDVGAALNDTIDIKAITLGPGGQIQADATAVQSMAFIDVLDDPTWTVTRLECLPGTERERDDAVRARVRQDLIDSRVGFAAFIAQAMKDAGAQVVAMFASDYLGADQDLGLNRVYVGDSSFVTTQALLTACRLTVPGCAVAGTSVQVLAMQSFSLFLTVSLFLWDQPERLNLATAQQAAVDAIAEYFATRDNAFTWSASPVRSAVMRAVPNVRSVDVLAFSDAARTVSAPEPVLADLFDTSGPLKRYSLDPWAIRVAVAGPT